MTLPTPKQRLAEHQVFSKQMEFLKGFGSPFLSLTLLEGHKLLLLDSTGSGFQFLVKRLIHCMNLHIL